MWGSIKRDAADIVFSKFIRLSKNWTCEHCHKFQGEGGGEASHFFGRRAESVRYDTENVFCLCRFCHRDFTENPEKHRAWVFGKLGERRFKALTVRANLYMKRDRKLALMVWKKAYEDLCKSKK